MPRVPNETIAGCSQMLASRKKSIAFAESATAGSLMAAFACTEQSGTILKGGIVCYDAQIKTGLLGVDPALVQEFTAESIPVTEAITRGLKPLVDADYYIGLTGLIKPGGSESPEKPVGTIFTCILEGDKMLVDKTLFEGDEIDIIEQATEHLCMLLIENLSARQI